MRLKEERMRCGLMQADVIPALKSIDGRFGPPELSRCESGLVRLTPAMLKKIASVYGVRPDQLYSPEDVDYGVIRPRKKEKQAGISEYYKPTGRVKRALASDFMASMDALGYSGFNDWLNDHIRRTIKEAARKKKIAAGAATPTTSQEEKIGTKLYHEK